MAVFVTSCGLKTIDGSPVNMMLYYDVVTAWYAVTATLQLFTTGMIMAKLLLYRRSLRKYGIPAFANGLQYQSSMGIFAESALVYTMATVAFIPMFRSNSPVQIWWGQFVGSLAVRASSPSRVLSHGSWRRAYIVPQPSLHHPSCDHGPIVHVLRARVCCELDSVYNYGPRESTAGSCAVYYQDDRQQRH
jgi:hypothetical protein